MHFLGRKRQKCSVTANYPPHCKKHFWNMQNLTPHTAKTIFEICKTFWFIFFWIAQNHFLTKPFDRNWSHDSRKVWHFGIRNIFEIIFLKNIFQKYLQQFFQYPSVILFWIRETNSYQMAWNTTFYSKNVTFMVLLTSVQCKFCVWSYQLM